MRDGVEWHCSIRHRNAPDALIEMISLIDTPGDIRGFWLDPAWQGQGLMSQAVGSVTAFWFEVLDRPVLRTPKAAANVPSRNEAECG